MYHLKINWNHRMGSSRRLPNDFSWFRGTLL